MQRKEFVSLVAEKTGMKLKDINVVIDGVVEVMGDAFDANERVELRGFGNFIPKTRKARKARNISTGETVDVPEKRILTFKQSSLFKK